MLVARDMCGCINVFLASELPKNDSFTSNKYVIIQQNIKINKPIVLFF